MLHSLQWWKTQKLYDSVLLKNKGRFPEKEYDAGFLIKVFEDEWIREAKPLITDLLDRLLNDEDITEKMFEDIMSELGDASNGIDFIADWVREVYNYKMMRKEA